MGFVWPSWRLRLKQRRRRRRDCKGEEEEEEVELLTNLLVSSAMGSLWQPI
jgi:hypothetical protein